MSETNGQEMVKGAFTTTLLGLLAKATANELDELDQTISTKEKELATLKSLRATLAGAIGEEQTEDSDDVTEQRRLMLARYLSINGPTNKSKIRQTMNMIAPVLHSLIAHPWFRQFGSSVELTQDGRQAATQAVEAPG